MVTVTGKVKDASKQKWHAIFQGRKLMIRLLGWQLFLPRLMHGCNHGFRAERKNTY
jgi:hypothetical protein